MKKCLDCGKELEEWFPKDRCDKCYREFLSEASNELSKLIMVNKDVFERLSKK